MALIQSKILIDSSPENVWNIVSDLDNEPKFWKGTKAVMNISKEGNVVNRIVTIAFRDQKCKQTVTLHPKEKIEALFTEGIIKGSKIIELKQDGNQTDLTVVWDISLSGMMGMFTGMVKKHIKNGTEQALKSIKDQAER